MILNINKHFNKINFINSKMVLNGFISEKNTLTVLKLIIYLWISEKTIENTLHLNISLGRRYNTDYFATKANMIAKKI